MVSAVFIAEFQAMFAMNRNSVSIGYGIAAPGVADHRVQHAVRRQRRLPGERLVDAERRAVGVDQQILRPVREAERRPGSGLPGAICAGLPAGLVAGGMGRGIGRLVAEAARAYRSLPSSICSRCSARQVWKPLEWAEMPRIACIATGRPTIWSCRRPSMSVQG